VRAVGPVEYEAWRETHGYRPRTWTHSATCVTPLKDLPWFVGEILEGAGPLEEVGVMVDVILSTRSLERLRKTHGISEPVGQSPFHLASTPEETRDLLVAAFADPVDFRVFSVPKRLVLFGDHDELTTFYGMSKSTVSRIATRLKGKVRVIEGPARQQP
jgi:hypothetical protein